MISDCSGLLDLLDKSLCEVRNHRLQNILERVQPYNWKVEHIVSEKNKVCDALSRLCKSVAGYSRCYPLTPPRLLDLKKKLAKHVKQLEQERLRSNKLGPYYSVWGQPRYHLILFSFLLIFILFYFNFSYFILLYIYFFFFKFCLF